MKQDWQPLQSLQGSAAARVPAREKWARATTPDPEVCLSLNCAGNWTSNWGLLGAPALSSEDSLCVCPEAVSASPRAAAGEGCCQFSGYITITLLLTPCYVWKLTTELSCTGESRTVGPQSMPALRQQERESGLSVLHSKTPSQKTRQDKTKSACIPFSQLLGLNVPKMVFGRQISRYI